MNRNVYRVSTAVLALGLIGCGGSDEPKVDEIDTAYVSAVCDMIANCPGAISEISVIVNAFTSQTDATCEEALGALGEFTAPREAVGVEEGTIVFHGDRLKACLDAVGSSCVGFVGFGALDACRSIFSGTLELGGTCRVDAECAGDAYCANDFQCAGTCTARVATGAACTSSNQCTPASNAVADCESTLENPVPHCTQTTIESGRGAGAQCGDVDDEGDAQVIATCARNLYCRTTGDSDVGTCATPIATSQPCTGDDVCAEGFCSDGTCLRPTIQRTAGATCDLEEGTICDADRHLSCGEDGTCVAVGDGTLGSTCATENDEQFLPLFTCNDGLYCDRTRTTPSCQVKSVNGALCEDDINCESSYCNDDGVCAVVPLCEPVGI